MIVADTSVLNYLIQLGLENLLESSFGSIVVPEGVRDELSDPASPAAVRAWIAEPSSWLQIVPVGEPLELGLGRGESEAIALAVGRGCPVILDDRAAREAAKRLSVSIIGTLSVIGHLSSEHALNYDAEVRRLLDAGFRATPEVIEEARRLWRAHRR